MVTQAGAVVIGAGALGLSTAMNLAKLGLKQVVVMERFRVGSQTSRRAASLFKLIQANELRTRLAQLSIREVARFREETGVDLPVVRSGSILAAYQPEFADIVRHDAEQVAAWGIELELIDGREAHRRAPFLSPDGVRIAVHTPGDIYIDEPADMLRAWQQAGERLGVTFVEHTPVIGIRIDHSQVTGVLTSQGEIATPIVVDAAGAWARALGELAGVTMPIATLRNQLAITEPIEGLYSEHPILRVIDTAFYARPNRGGLLVGGLEGDPMAVNVRTQPTDFSIDDVPLDPSVVHRLVQPVVEFVPALRDTSFADVRGGLFTMTPDGDFLVGPMPGVHGLWAATGCNGSGFSFAPALGKVLAEWIVGGEPSIDISSFAPGRFGAYQIDEERLLTAAVWHYTHWYTPEPGTTR